MSAEVSSHHRDRPKCVSTAGWTIQVRACCGRRCRRCCALGGTADADECPRVSPHAQREAGTHHGGPRGLRQDRDAASRGGDSISTETGGVAGARRSAVAPGARRCGIFQPTQLGSVVLCVESAGSSNARHNARISIPTRRRKIAQRTRMESAETGCRTAARSATRNRLRAP